ncbi:hypothetical protein [Bradyrhizobium elkanii]|uniref:hypothetical protein n=1 Tax=Bradyrhizobium elkanii TaxID=29448 RepID=UPI001BAD0462|nr:hypothetical protein [Bradyrhizobium elkanii]MBR1160256.1 hypothetical protein [Bradyrhizobium elkanii]
MDTKERKTPASGALFSSPDPKLAPGTAASGKKRLRRRDIDFKGVPKIFAAIFLRLILRCSVCSNASHRASAFADQVHHLASFFHQ